MSLEYCTPDDIPEILRPFDKNTPQMDVGKTGKVGYLTVDMKFDTSKKKTIITKQKSQVPLYLQKALHYDSDYPSMAHLFVLSPSGGILQGDRYRLDVRLENNAISHVTTQGATRIYKMDSNFATHMINLNVRNNSYLEFIPEQLIPYSNSRYYQKACLNVDASSTLLYSETVVPGRVAMGEFFDYEICYLKSIGIEDKNIKFCDSCLMNPKEQKVESLSMFGNHTILSTVYIITKNKINDVKDLINKLLKENDEVNGGASLLPNDCGIGIRILGDSTEIQKTTVYNISKIVRQNILPAYL